MKNHACNLLTAAVLGLSAATASGDPLDVPVPGSDPNSEPCTPTQRTDEYGTSHFNDDVRQSQGKTFDAVLFGDSITDFWVYSNLSFDDDASKTINMGIGSDRVQHLLWRVKNGALDGYATEYFTVLIGVNNGYQKHVDNHSDPCDRAEDLAEGIRLVLQEMVAKHPQAKILLMPILPYGFDSRYYPGLDVRTVNEDVNDIIIKFVDYKNVFWVDLRPQYLNSDATCKASVFGGPGGSYDAPGHYLHPHTDSYPAIWKPALKGAMAKYHDVAGGLPHVADPSVGYASAAQCGYDHAATITVCGILTGTDANAVPVATYSLSYRLDDGPWTMVLRNQSRSLTRASFAIPDVALGDHVCNVKVVTADAKTLETSVEFTMHDGWTGAPLPSDESAINTNGTLVCAYACGNYTVNGVPFAGAGGSVDDANITWPFGSTSGSQAPDGVASGGYRELLKHCWWANAGEKEVTLKNLEPGHDYLVQIVGFRNYDGYDKAHVWIKESFRDANFVKVAGDGWPCGGVLTGVFTATESTKKITVCGDNNWAVNGIQVRDLGASGAPVVVPPSIGSLSVTTNGTAASFFLSGIAMGTDDAGTNATSYSVSYSLNGATAVTALTGQTGTSATFAVSNLADGEYTCAVTITTDKNKTSAAKSVSFRIGTPSGGGGDSGGGDDGSGGGGSVEQGWTSGPMSSTGDTIRTDGTLVYAYAVRNVTVGGVTFASTSSFGAPVMVSAHPSPTGYVLSDFQNEGVSGGFGGMLESGWHWGQNGDPAAELVVTLTLTGLTAGNTYLVQLVSHRHSNSTLVSAEGSTPVHIYGTHDGVNYTYGASIVGVFTATGPTKDVVVTYSETSSGPRPLNAIQVRELGEGGGGGGGEGGGGEGDEATVVAPSIGSVSATTNGTTATIALSGVAMGTDDLGTNATSYAVSYVLNGGATVAALSGQTGATASFDIENLADGNYTCAVTITTDKNKTASKSVSFTIDTSSQGGGGGGDPVVPVEAGWTASALGATSASIRTDGTLVYAYARGDYTANGVEFTGVGNGIVNNGNCVVWEATTGAQTVNPTVPDDTETGGYKDLLGHGWWATGKARKITLNNLEAGKQYLVQIIAFRHDFTTQSAIAPDGESTVRFGGTGWEYGGSLVGVFTASGTTEEFTIQYSGNACINAIQVRELPEDAPAPPAPVIGGGEGGEAPFSVGDDSVSILIANAVEGATYVFKKSATLGALAAADVDPRKFTATSNGVLRIVLPIEAGEENACFYRFGVE